MGHGHEKEKAVRIRNNGRILYNKNTHRRKQKMPLKCKRCVLGNVVELFSNNLVRITIHTLVGGNKPGAYLVHMMDESFMSSDQIRALQSPTVRKFLGKNGFLCRA